MNREELTKYVMDGCVDEMISKIICDKVTDSERERYVRVLDSACERYGDGDYHFISSPGRSEIGGNHTDHQHGNVVACGLNIDNLAAVKPRDDTMIHFYDPMFGECSLDIEDLSIHEDEVNTSAALVRGITARMLELGYKVGGFDAVCDSKVLPGSGISSSACFEVMIVECFNCLYNADACGDIERALISQYSENVYFGKPCGLMDQLAISTGGFTAIDFKDPQSPVVNNYDFSFDSYGYKLVLVNTRGDHADLSHEYAAVPNEIKEVAAYFGKNCLRDIDENDFYARLKEVRESVGNDRGILRSIHFYNENRRAVEEREAISEGRVDDLLDLMKESGRSSFMYLQNVYPSSRPLSQSLSLGLALSEKVLGDRGAFRVHGGGFEGTVLAIVPNDLIDEYISVLDGFFGKDSCLVMSVRSFGTRMII